MTGSSDRLEEAILGYQSTAVIRAVIELDLPDLMAGGSSTVVDLARAAGCEPDRLVRLLRAMTVLDLCEPTDPDSDGYRLTGAGRSLLRESPTPHRQLAELAVDQYWSSWADLAGSVRTGTSAFSRLHGSGPFEWRRDHPAAGATFDTWLTKWTGRSVGPVAEGINLDGVAVVAEVGGGRGVLLQALLERRAELQGVLFDQPAVVTRAESDWPEALAARTTFVGGDFFAAVPVRADLYVLKSVVHDWTDAEAVALLRACASSMPTGARLVLVERAVDDPAGDRTRTVMLDLHMMAVTGGRERTRGELAALLGAAGLVVTGEGSTGAGFRTVEAVRP